MRVVSLSQLKAGQILGQTFYSENGQVLLRRGTKLTDFFINRLIEAGYSSVYIWQDQLEYVIEDVVRPEIRQKAVNDLRKFFSAAHNQPTKDAANHLQDNIHVLKANASSIIDELFNKKDIVVELIDIKNVNNGLYQHSVNVMIHSVILGISIGLNRVEVSKLALAALLHDIGLMFIPQDILNKKEKLSKEEMLKAQQHTSLGYGFLRDKLNLEATVRIGVLEHHENYDGSGYPNNKVGQEIHLLSRIISIANKYDSIISDRVYKKASPVSEALEFIMGGGGTYFDPKLVKVFIKHINPYPVNTLVKVDDGNIAVVTEVNSHFFTRPVLKIISGNQKGKIIDLLKEKNIVIRTSV
ncbi:HD-GYP domain-containing protein [Alkaliphilus serpentinus]|uniref:HD-GYP domain-containing protein n=1 Tax=Alkaliphilus serpentinus TaxID=1482731 RepID=A0A833HM83_9FIRM|nr:HD-GYP domain-containing protein [Alkaliphilus serpentinus]KAB3527274.1 HD-GYP domain-containing protein [Alkaliphilus serpentinus]